MEVKPGWSRVTCGKGGGRRKWCKEVYSHLWGSGVWGWGDSLPQTLITKVLFCYVYISRPSGTLGWEPQIASSCSLAFYSRGIIPPTLIHPPSFIVRGLLSPTKLMRGGWVRSGWHHACVAGLLWLLPSRGALAREKTRPVARWARDPVPVSPEFILTVRFRCRREFFLDQVDTTGWGLLSLWH